MDCPPFSRSHAIEGITFFKRYLIGYVNISKFRIMIRAGDNALVEELKGGNGW